MGFFRSSFLAAIVSLLVLTGLGHNLLGGCDTDSCGAGGPAASEQVAAHPADRDSGHGDECCECFCHQVAAQPVAALADFRGGQVTGEAEFAARFEIPPDTEPQGIDHPPQLG